MSQLLRLNYSATKLLIAGVILAHVMLLAYSATRHSPVLDETGHLPAGISHWRLNQFDLYSVNPPLIRCVATLPVVLSREPFDLTGYQVLPQHRSEFRIGAHWLTTRSERVMPVCRMARWACLPFAVMGAITCLLWARDLYGTAAGLVALCLWCFSPTVLAHASLITPDAGAAAVGVTACYWFWRWLRCPSLLLAIVCGILFGLTLLTKFTWVVLVPLWVSWWAVWRLPRGVAPKVPPAEFAHSPNGASHSEQQVEKNPSLLPSLAQLLIIYSAGWWVLCSGYLFEDVFQPLGDFRFASSFLGGDAAAQNPEDGGNRFRGTLLAHVPVPVPRNVLQGIDHLKWEYEHGYRSYLRGVTKRGGWWYYYLYAMLVKMPVGTLLLIGIAAGISANQIGRSLPQTARRMWHFHRHSKLKVGGRMLPKSDRGISICDELFLLSPAVLILTLVSSQTGFNHHLRYVLPAFPFLFIFTGRSVLLVRSSSRLVRTVPLLALACSVISSLSVYPHSLSYFNEVSGGPVNGWRHLDKSNTDWGQDLLMLNEWSNRHPERRPVYVASYGMSPVEILGAPAIAPTQQQAPLGMSEDGTLNNWAPGWYILSVTRLVDPAETIHDFLKLQPIETIGYSLQVYHIPEKNAWSEAPP